MRPTDCLRAAVAVFLFALCWGGLILQAAKPVIRPEFGDWILVLAFIGLPFGIRRVVYYGASDQHTGLSRFLVGLALASVPVACWSQPVLEDLMLQRAVRHGEPVVGAITRYEFEHREPPRNLTDLVPRYIPKLTGTGLPACPTWVYSIRYIDSPAGVVVGWTLSVACRQSVLLYYEDPPECDSMEGDRCVPRWRIMED